MNADHLASATLTSTCLRDLLAIAPSARSLHCRDLAFSPRPRRTDDASRQTASALRHLSGAVRHLEAAASGPTPDEAIAILRRLEREVFRSSPAVART